MSDSQKQGHGERKLEMAPFSDILGARNAERRRMEILKILILIPTVGLMLFGFYTRYRYKKGKWIDGKELSSRKQSKIEAGLAFGCFIAAMGLLCLYASL